MANKLSKQDRDQQNLKKNLIYILENFDKYVSKDKRSNYLMAISISCKPGEFSFSYGSDPVADEIKTIKNNLKKQKKG